MTEYPLKEGRLLPCLSFTVPGSALSEGNIGAASVGEAVKTKIELAAHKLDGSVSLCVFLFEIRQREGGRKDRRYHCMVCDAGSKTAEYPGYVDMTHIRIAALSIVMMCGESICISGQIHCIQSRSRQKPSCSVRVCVFLTSWRQ